MIKYVFKPKLKSERGFTLAEVVLSLGIISLIFGFVVINLARLTRNTSVITARDVIISDIRSQQEKAMSGTDIAGSGGVFGIYFNQHTYILLAGSAYTESDPANVLKTLPDNIFIDSITFPSSQIIFASKSGEILNFTTGQNTFRVTNSPGTEESTVELNRLGVVSEIN